MSAVKINKRGYVQRIIDEKIEEYLRLFGAILIEGPKWCGKTWTALSHANSVVYVMDPAGNYNNRTLARINPATLLNGETPRVIDEWQEEPGIWDAVRFEIDQNPGYGKFILTGSVFPPRDSYLHSGTGRIATLNMRPMTLYESNDSSGTVSLGAIFANEDFEPFNSEISINRLIDITVRGGWPETLKLPIKNSGLVAIEYVNAIIRNELFRDDHPKKDRAKLRRLLRSLARNNATTASVKTLATDTDGQIADGNNAAISRDSVADYIRILKETFVIEDIPPWNPEIRSKTIMRQAPKRVFTDPSLAIAALGAGTERLFNDLKTFGFMFENLCLRDLFVYSNFYGGSVSHYRDNSGLEIDAIVEMPDGSWGAFEIKLGETQVNAAANTLLRMRQKMTASGMDTPSCLAVITGGGIAMRREDGVYVLPINAIKH